MIRDGPPRVRAGRTGISERRGQEGAYGAGEGEE